MEMTLTLEQAAFKQYSLFVKMTTRNPPFPWEELPDMIKDAWKEVVRTCPRVKKKEDLLSFNHEDIIRNHDQRIGRLEEAYALYVKPRK
jgi:hypothetical protein